MNAGARDLVLAGLLGLLGLQPSPAPAALSTTPGESTLSQRASASASPLPAPDDPAFNAVSDGLPVQWPLHALEAVQAWSRYPGGYFAAADRPQTGPIVALIGTGVDSAHPDFRNPGATSAAAADGGQLLLSAARTFMEGDRRDGAAEAPDDHGHGTHLAGIIAAATNNGATAGSGIAGLAYPVRLLPLKVAGADGVALQADLARAIRYAADRGASVIVIGLAGPVWSDIVQEAVDSAWERGCLLVAPAGDAMFGLPAYPAACPHVLGVAALDAWGEVPWYSNGGWWVDLSAPGGDQATGIYSMLPTNACTLRQDPTSQPYGWLYGTAQAAGHVAAAAGLLAGAQGIEAPSGEEGALVWQALQRAAGGRWSPETGRGPLALTPLLDGTPPPADTPAGIVGRVLLGGAPAPGATVVAEPLAGGEPAAASASAPAGAYRLANLAPGVYRLRASLGEAEGVWESTMAVAGADAPGVNFRLGDPPADASLVEARIPEAAIRGSAMQISLTLLNTGESTWRRLDGYRLKQCDATSPFFAALPEVGLVPARLVAPGDSYTFSVSVPVPDMCGFAEMSWRMCQEGGQGSFGPVARGRVSVTSFLDVPADHWAVSEIEAVRAAGVVQGYGDGRYQPEAAVSRDQMAVYLSRTLMGGEEGVPEGPAEPSFPDVGLDHWAYRHIEHIRSAAVAEGYPDGTYAPGKPVDRGQMAAFVVRALVGGEAGLDGYEPPAAPSFPDVPPEAWMHRHVEYLRARQVVGGYPDGWYHPEIVCARDQMAVYLARAFFDR